MKTANEYEYSGKEDIQIIKPNMSNAELSKSLSVFIVESYAFAHIFSGWGCHFHRKLKKKKSQRRKKKPTKNQHKTK